MSSEKGNNMESDELGHPLLDTNLPDSLWNISVIM